MNKTEALPLLKDMHDNGIFFKQYEEALDVAIKAIEGTCTCGNEVKVYCTKCGGYVKIA